MSKVGVGSRIKTAKGVRVVTGIKDGKLLVRNDASDGRGEWKVLYNTKGAGAQETIIVMASSETEAAAKARATASAGNVIRATRNDAARADAAFAVGQRVGYKNNGVEESFKILSLSGGQAQLRGYDSNTGQYYTTSAPLSRIYPDD